MYEAEKRVRRYERVYGQRVLRPLCSHLFKVLPTDAMQSGVWLDWQAGPGIVTSELQSRLSPDTTLLATEEDRAALRVFHSHRELDRDERCFVRQDPPDNIVLANGVVDVAVGHFRWQTMEAPEGAVAELCRVVRPGGLVVLSFLLPGAVGTLYDTLANVGATDIANALHSDGLTSARVRELLRGGNCAQIDVRTFSHEVTIGPSSRPMMDPLLLDFLLPRWMSRASGEEVTSVADEPFDLGAEPLSWSFKIGVAVGTLPVSEEMVDAGDTSLTPLPKDPYPSGKKESSPE